MRIRKGLIFFFLIANALFAASNLSLFLKINKTPQGTFFPYIHGFHHDYYLYLSVLRESIKGSWSTPALFTSEPTNGSYWYASLIGMGKLGALLHLDAIATYHLCRFLAIQLILIGVYLVTKEVLQKKWGLVASYLSILWTVPPFFIMEFFGLRIPPWWSDYLGPVAIFNFLPHHAFGIGLLFITFYFILKLIKGREQKYFFLSIAFSLLSALLFPPSGLALSFSLVLGLIIYQSILIINFRKIDRTLLFSVMMLVVAAVTGLIMMKLETAKGFPWSQWKSWDVNMWKMIEPNLDKDLILGAIIPIILTIPALFQTIFRRRNHLWLIFLITWAFSPYILSPFSEILQIGKIRLALLGNFLPLAILSVVSLEGIFQKIDRKQKKYLGILLILLCIFLVVPQSIHELELRVKEISVGYINIDIPDAYMEAIRFLGDKATPYSVILSDDYIGNIIPAFISLKTYFAHVTQTQNYPDKLEIVKKFYEGKMTNDEALKLVKTNNIKYIFYGYEIAYGGDISKYNLPLEKIYERQGIMIYEVR